MSSSSDDGLPEIPGTKYPWMDDGTSTSSRTPRKLPKRPRISAVEKEKNTFKGSRKEKKQPSMMDISSDDDFVDPKPGTSHSRRPPAPTNPEELRRQKVKENTAKWRARKSAEAKEQERLTNAKRMAAARANETPEEHLQRNLANAQQMAVA